jgi:hypothetical protein
MKSGLKMRFKSVATLSFAALAFGACSKDGPLNVYYGMATAAEFGDYDGFLKGFTKQSQQMIQSQLSLAETYGLKSENPVAMLVFPTVEEVVEEGDTATLSVVRGSVRKKIIMKKTEEEGWRVDVKALADFWEKNPK